ncbi:MAG: vWA domain-containing protein [Candidatus Woesearchaeota archaeon]
MMGSDRDISAEEEVEKVDGALERSKEEEKKLPKTVLPDDEASSTGKLLNEAIDRGISFNSDTIYKNLVSNYRDVDKIYGETFIRELTGYDSRYIDRNSKIPEFKRKLKDVIKRRLDEMKQAKKIDSNGIPTDDGVKLASISLCIQELDKITPKDIIGEQVQEKDRSEGPKDNTEEGLSKKFSYRDISVRKTLKTAARRGHKDVQPEDIKPTSRRGKGSIYVIYGLDVSGSMKGPKLNVAKKAGVALCYKAINQNDKVGLVAFNSDIVAAQEPTDDFNRMVDSMISLRASKETNIVHAIDKAIELFPQGDHTNHLLLITDAVPTVGEADETISAVMRAKSSNITISVVGIKLTEGLDLAQNIVEVSEGNLYVVRNLDELGNILLEDYYSL